MKKTAMNVQWKPTSRYEKYKLCDKNTQAPTDLDNKGVENIANEKQDTKEKQKISIERELKRAP